MSRMTCPRCGTEFEIYEKNRSNLNEINGIAHVVNGFNNNKHIEKENDNMMNGMDMEMLAKMVAAQIKNEVKEVSKTPVATTVDGGMWAKTSRFYGNEICGYAYNPYLVRRFLPKQFMNMMDEFNFNVNEGIRCEYGYMKGIIYLIDECEKLAMLQKRDKIAYDERSKFWSVDDCRKVFIQYVNDCLKEIERLKRTCTLKTKHIKIPKRGEISVNVMETIKDHRVVFHVTLNSNIETELEMLKANLEKCYSYKEIANIMKAFKLIPLEGSRTVRWSYNYNTHTSSKRYYKNYNGYELPKEFVKGFKKSGAYYTLKNLIMFEYKELKGLKGREAIAYMRNLLDCGTEDYIFYAMLKEVLDR